MTFGSFFCTFFLFVVAVKGYNMFVPQRDSQHVQLFSLLKHNILNHTRSSLDAVSNCRYGIIQAQMHKMQLQTDSVTLLTLLSGMKPHTDYPV